MRSTRLWALLLGVRQPVVEDAVGSMIAEAIVQARLNVGMTIETTGLSTTTSMFAQVVGNNLAVLSTRLE